MRWLAIINLFSDISSFAFMFTRGVNWCPYVHHPPSLVPLIEQVFQNAPHLLEKEK